MSLNRQPKPKPKKHKINRETHKFRTVYWRPQKKKTKTPAGEKRKKTQKNTKKPKKDKCK